MEIVGVHPVVCSEHVFSAFSYPLQFFYLSSDKAMWYSDKVMWCLVMVMLCWSVDGIININLVPRSTYLYGTSSKNAWNKSRTTCTSLPSSRRRWRLLVRILCSGHVFSAFSYPLQFCLCLRRWCYIWLWLCCSFADIFDGIIYIYLLVRHVVQKCQKKLSDHVYVSPF